MYIFTQGIKYGTFSSILPIMLLISIPEHWMKEAKNCCLRIDPIALYSVFTLPFQSSGDLGTVGKGSG